MQHMVKEKSWTNLEKKIKILDNRTKTSLLGTKKKIFFLMNSKLTYIIWRIGNEIYTPKLVNQIVK